jgi:UDP-N-acetylglucosamine 4,6-dehydratase
MDMGSYYVIQPEFEWWDKPLQKTGQPVPDGFSYASDTNTQWLTVEQLVEMVRNVPAG